MVVLPETELLAAAFTTTVAPQVVGLVALGLLTCALALRRWLPIGVVQGVFGLTVTAALLAMYVQPDVPNWEFRLAMALAGLAFVWFAAARWIEKPTLADLDSLAPQPATLKEVDTIGVRRQVGIHFVSICGLLLAALVIADRAGDRAIDRTTGLSLLLIIWLLAALEDWHVRFKAARLRLDPTGQSGFLPLSSDSSLPPSAARYSVAGLTLLVIYYGLEPGRLAATDSSALPGLLLATSLVALAASVFPLWRHWKRRRTIWLTHSAGLAEPLRCTPFLDAVALAGALAVAMTVLLVPTVGFRLPALFIVAFAAGGIAHRNLDHARRFGPFVAILIWMIVAQSVLLFVPAHGLGLLFAVAVASVFLLWLSFFWEHQLDEGRAWTTAGALVGPLRSLAVCGVGLAVFVAAEWLFAGGADAPRDVTLVVLTTTALATYAWLLFRVAHRNTGVRAAWAACLSMLLILVPVWPLADDPDPLLTILYRIGWLSPLLFFRLAFVRPPVAALPVYHAYIGGILPALAMILIGVELARTGGSLVYLVQLDSPLVFAVLFFLTRAMLFPSSNPPVGLRAAT